MLLIAERRDVAVALGITVEHRNASEAARQIFYARVERRDLVVARLAVEFVLLDAACDRDDDVAKELIVDSQLKVVGEDAGHAGVGRLRDDLLSLEADVDQPGR